MTLLWSAKNNAFFPSDMVETYEAAGWVLDDTIEATDDMIVYQGASPAGKIRTVGADGMPAWSDIPAPTRDEMVATADNTKSALLASARSTISLWQSELLLGSISDEDKASLTTWIAYIKAVQAVDTSIAPSVTWPTIPAA